MMKRFFIFAIVVACCLFTLPAQRNAKGGVHTLSEKEFKARIFDYSDTNSYYHGSTPIVVDFYADWCGPCRKLAPTMEELSKKYEGKVIFYKVDIEKSGDISKAFAIDAIPTILYIKADVRPKRSVGFLTKDQLIEIIEKVLLD